VLEHAFGVVGDPLLDEVDIDAFCIVLFLFKGLSPLLILLGSFLHASESRDCLLSELVNFLQLSLRLLQYLVLFGDLLLLILEILAGGLLELEEAILVVLPGSIGLLFLLLPPFDLRLEASDTSLLLGNLLGNRLFLLGFLALKLGHLVVQAFHLGSVLLLDGENGLLIILGDSQALLAVMFSLELFAFEGLNAAGPLVLQEVFDVGLHGHGHLSDSIENLLLLLCVVLCFGLLLV
jgi:hypothetical protein